MTTTETQETAVEVDTVELARMYRQLHTARTLAKKYGDDEKQVLDKIREILGTATELVDEGGATWATWRQGKPRETTDWDAVTAALEAQGVDIGPVVKEHTVVKPGSRSLRVDAGLKLAEAAAAVEDLF